MRLHTDPNSFSITALLADQVTLVARHEGLPPGAARLLLDQLMAGTGGHRRLLRIIERAWRTERNPAEAAKLAVIHGHTAAWLVDGGADDGEREPQPPTLRSDPRTTGPERRPRPAARAPRWCRTASSGTGVLPGR
ncbi:hypothetical protein [Azospirillum halopraeferens]|uniref:hypothetical protein n=1 Tax=Azospirillum halopraeferens TaxID=34010 RepID=UPI00040B62F8|nr:hypothetical protein [Azospirillum halopraeferens]